MREGHRTRIARRRTNIRVARAQRLYAAWFRMGLKAPVYEDYVEKKKTEGVPSDKIMSKEDWQVKVLGVVPEETKGEEGAKKEEETKGEKAQAPAESSGVQSLILPSPDDKEIKRISERAGELLSKAVTGPGKAFLGYLQNRKAEKVKKEQQETLKKGLEEFDLQMEQQVQQMKTFNQEYDKQFKEYSRDQKKEGRKPKPMSEMSEDEKIEEKNKFVAWLEGKPGREKAQAEALAKKIKDEEKATKKQRTEDIKKKHGWFGVLADKASVLKKLKPPSLRMALFGEEGVQKAEEKKLKKDEQKKFRKEVKELRGMVETLKKVVGPTEFAKVAPQVQQAMTAHVLAYVMKNADKLTGNVPGQSSDQRTAAQSILAAILSNIVNPHNDVVESTIEDIETTKVPTSPEQAKAMEKAEKGYQDYVRRMKEKGVPDAKLMAKEDWEEAFGIGGSGMPSWLAEEEAGPEKGAAKKKKKAARLLALRWAAGPAEHLFFEDPEKREVRQLFDSGQKGNFRSRERLQGAPPTPVQVRNTVPGGRSFRTLNRYILDTEEDIHSERRASFSSWTFAPRGRR